MVKQVTRLLGTWEYSKAGLMMVVLHRFKVDYLNPIDNIVKPSVGKGEMIIPAYLQEVYYKVWSELTDS